MHNFKLDKTIDNVIVCRVVLVATV